MDTHIHQILSQRLIQSLMLLLCILFTGVPAGTASANQVNNWVVISSPTSDTLYDVTYGDGRFIAVGNGIFSSENGNEWTKTNDTSTILKAVSFANDQFVGVGQRIRTETNLICSYHYSGGVNTGFSFTKFYHTYVYTSSDGISFTESDIASDITVPVRTKASDRVGANEIDFYDMIFFDGSFYVVGEMEIHYDDVRMYIEPGTFPDYLPIIRYDHICTTKDVLGVIQSADGTDWTFSFGNSGPAFHAITSGTDMVVAVGANGEILISSDGSNWTSQSSGTSNSLYGVTCGNSTYVAVGENGTVLTSSDGSNWTSQSSGTSNSLYGVTCGNTRYVAVGDNGTILQSELPPTISSTEPNEGETNVAISTKIKATFSKQMDSSKINSNTFSLDNVAGTVTYDFATKTATFTPSENLDYSTTYTATITTDVTDLIGNAMEEDYVWSFTTEPDTTPPTVSSTAPANNATDVAANTAITATFSEAMDSLSITTATFFVNDGTINIAGTVTTVTQSGTVATFTPTTASDYSTTYTATITTGAKDLAGNALETDYTWSFTTESETPTDGESPSDGGGGSGCFISVM